MSARIALDVLIIACPGVGCDPERSSFMRLDPLTASSFQFNRPPHPKMGAFWLNTQQNNIAA